MKENEKAPKKTEEPKSLTSGELKDQLKTIEAEILELEKKIELVNRLKEENQDFRGRMRNLQRALYGVLFHAFHPSDPKLVKKYLNVLGSDLEALKEKDQQKDPAQQLA